jgi:hypothetical protein
VVVVVVAADPMVVVEEDWRASARPGPGSWPPRPRQQSFDASGSRPPRPHRGGGGPQQTTRRRGVAGAASLPPPPGATWGGGTVCSFFALVQRAGNRGGGAGSPGGGAGSHAAGWGPPAGASKIRIPRWGSWPPIWRTATPLSSKVGSMAKIAVLNPRSSQSAGMSWGRIRDSGMKDSPVIPFTRTSSSSQVRSVPGPCWIRPMSFEPVNQQHRRALLYSARSGASGSRRPRASTSGHRTPRS